MKSIVKTLAALLSLAASSLVQARSPWSSQDYDLYPGDFNGDGLTDMLYIAKDSAHLNGIVLSDGAGLNTPLQSWGDGYLGIPWSDGTYRAVVADFNGDGKADIFLQRTSPGDHFLLLTNGSGVTAISQSVANNASGLLWSADQHQLISADFNGDGKADLFFQPTDAKGLSAILLADANGQFTAKLPDQSWNDGYEGFSWATNESIIVAGDFNGDGLGDLLIQSLPFNGTGPGTARPAQFSPNSNGASVVQAAKQLFSLDGVQAWSQHGFSADWSPMSSAIIVSDFNADRRSDVMLQGLSAKDPSYLLLGHSPGPIFGNASRIGGDALPAATTYVAVAGRFMNAKGSGLYLQSTSPDRTNSVASVSGSVVALTQSDASLPVSTQAPPASAGATLASARTMAAAAAPATLTVTSAGRTPGTFSVSGTGAAKYQIPIWMPAGPRGVQPKLSIVYSSQAGDGILGPGWSMAGLSAITRCNKTYAQDTTPAPVALVTTDGYCLNGNRLRLTSGIYGTTGSIYQTELADFSQITAGGTAGNGPAEFIVKGKDGLTYEYGNSTDSRILYGTTAGVWLLNKVYDRFGNNYIVTYTTGATGSSLIGVPDKIYYTPTAHNATNYSYTVAFAYSTRASKVPGTNSPLLLGYINGNQIVNTNLLTSISVLSGTVLQREYFLNYGAAPTTIRARLTSVQECGGSAGTDCLAPTQMTYQDGSPGVSTTVTTALSGATGPITVIATRDFNSDGRDDIVYVDGNSVNGTVKVLLASGSGYGPPITLTTGYAGGFGLISTGDLLGVGRSDIALPVSGVMTRYTYNGASFTSTSLSVSVPANSIRAGLTDINGDGLPDLVFITKTETSSGGSYTEHFTALSQLNTSTGGVVSISGTVNSTGPFDATCVTSEFGCRTATIYVVPPGASPAKTFDFNGDGRGDLAWVVHTTSNGTSVTSLTSNGATFSMGVGLGDHAATTAAVAFGNWNNDACTDVITQTLVMATPCNGSPVTVVSLPLPATGAIDWDGDGKMDALVVNGSNAGVYESTATGVSSLITTTLPIGTWGPGGSNTQVTDQQGDGQHDLLAFSSTGITVNMHNSPGVPPDLLTSIADGYSVTDSPTYTSIAQGSYTKGSGAVFPDQDYIGPVFVTKQVLTTDGISTSGTYSQTYTYTNARQDLQGRGFEGFQTRKVVDSRSNATVRMTYYLNGQNAASRFPLTGMEYQDDVLQSNGTTLISSDVITNVITTLDNTTNNKRFFPHVSTSATTQYEVGGTKNGLTSSLTTLTYTFDTSGNATTVAKTVKDTDAGSPYLNQIWGTTTTRTITPNIANWCLGLPTQVQVSNTAPGVPSIARTTGYTPDYANCRETQRVIEPSNATYKVTEVFGFDSFGNMNSDSVTGVGMTARTTSTTWTDTTRTTGQFPITVTNALTQVDKLGYNYDLGVVTTHTDANNVQTSWDYDSFARRKLETRPDGTTTETTYNLCASVSGGCQNGDPGSGVISINKMVVIDTSKDSSGSVVRDDLRYLDQLDRTIVTKAKTLAGGYSRVGAQFDALGRLYRVTAPCDAASCTVYWTTNSYDALSRLTQQQRPKSASDPTLQTTTLAYLGRTTTITDPQSKVATRISTVAGTLGRSQDHNGYYQNFVYDSFGSLLTVTDSLSNALFSATYDYGLAAYQRTTTDIDLGARSYNYNALGEVGSYSDAKGQNFTYDPYDALGRPTKRTEPDLVTTWTWGNSAASHNIGRLASVATTGATTYSEIYVYDSLGRLQTDTKQGKSFDYAYNTQGTLDTLTYPASTSSYRLKLKYLYQNGSLQQVKDFNATTVFWTANATNFRGEVTQETLGNGVVTNRGIDAVTGWLSSIQAGVGGGSGLQNQSYLYDLVGNVTQRQNSTLGLTESFCYDNVYRLDHSTLTAACTGTTNLQMAYDAMGNITSRSDINAGATWTYSTTHKHQALQAGDANHTYTYDANGNAITRNGQSIGWTSYNLPNLINATGESSNFTYGPNHEKETQVYTGPSGTETTTYYGNLLETVVTSTATDWRHYIYAGNELVSVYSRTSGGTNTFRYVLEDNLGSPSAITSSAGALLVNENFSAYGAQRDPSDWSGAPSGADLSTIAGISRNGFTGQTMLGNMGLVHLNGRVLDSVTGRFLSADPYISEPGNTQNFNRYGYVYNNPLSNIDPSGFETVTDNSDKTEKPACNLVLLGCGWDTVYQSGGSSGGSDSKSTDGNRGDSNGGGSSAGDTGGSVYDTISPISDLLAESADGTPAGPIINDANTAVQTYGYINDAKDLLQPVDTADQIKAAVDIAESVIATAIPPTRVPIAIINLAVQYFKAMGNALEEVVDKTNRDIMEWFRQMDEDTQNGF